MPSHYSSSLIQCCLGSEEYPTLLHFAARWGLEHLCMQLMDCPGGDVACELRNYSGKTPAELAEASGFTKLAGSLKSFSVRFCFKKKTLN